MRIATIEAFPIKLKRDLASATGTAGSPTALQKGVADYRWSAAYPCLYSMLIETALIRVTLDSGLIGWGEAQAPVAPEIACAIVERILVPAIGGEEFDGTLEDTHRLWWRMYSAMRVRGQNGGFMLDAISGVDLALWDLAGKIAGVSVSELLGTQRQSVPLYLSGVAGGNLDLVRQALDGGTTNFKLYFDSDKDSVFRMLDAVSAIAGHGRVAVDALWRLTDETAYEFGKELDERQALFLECPFPPEDPIAHGDLARRLRTPIALGESYRTRFELAPFFRNQAMRYVQPDLGRTGITEGRVIAELARQQDVAVVPHVSIAMGPQIAAAIHFAAAQSNCPMLEYNPAVLSTANRFLAEPLRVENGAYCVPRGPGLGVDLKAQLYTEA
ncbi:MAG TPA: mandelate racemase/muconate lactonizing enzyme family protein [Bryobacteraceae bacterium]|nr:mandelate racemase/muconate lactonizing enzyme family protein [Bryobacteraceae bacterium]